MFLNPKPSVLIPVARVGRNWRRSRSGFLSVFGSRNANVKNSASSEVSCPTTSTTVKANQVQPLRDEFQLQDHTRKVRPSLVQLPVALGAGDVRHLLSDFDTFIFDADGVLCLGDTPIHRSREFIEYLEQNNKRVIILTNNSTKSRKNYARKLHQMGFPSTLAQSNVINAAFLAAEFLHRTGIRERGKKAYVIGSQGLLDELNEKNIQHFGSGPDPSIAKLDDRNAFLFDLIYSVKPSDVGAVVVSYEKHFHYVKLMKAANYLRKQDCIFLATNEDETCPAPEKELIVPDAGPLVAAVRSASGRRPITVGKPNSPAFEYICRNWSVDPSRTVMIGDRTNTDVKFGKNHGLKTILVLSGVHQMGYVEEQIKKGKHNEIPDYYALSLGDLLPNQTL